MRSLITLTAEADSFVRKVMRERHLTSTDAVNAAILDGLAPRSSADVFSTPTFDLG